MVEALPDDQAALFAATIRALVADEYLLATYGLRAVVTTDLGESLQLPAEVALTGRAHAVLDGWPGAGPDELVENLLAVLVKQAAEEPDPARKRRLESFVETIREIGVTTVGDVLSRVLTGGL